MKYRILFLAVLFFGCKKNATEEGNGNRLQFIKSDGKINQSFTYNANGWLVKEDWFVGCEQTPTDEFSYTYTGAKLDSIKSVMRSLYSSTAALCDPAAGLRSFAVVEYDTEGRIHKITHENGTSSMFYYNSKGFIEKKVVSGGGNQYVHTYKRDIEGNIIEETDSQGNVTQYEFDNKTNPHYLIKQRPDIITAFYNSPNNVVKIKSGNSTTEIRYEYNRRGLPVKMHENAGTYEFVYR